LAYELPMQPIILYQIRCVHVAIKSTAHCIENVYIETYKESNTERVTAYLTSLFNQFYSLHLLKNIDILLYINLLTINRMKFKTIFLAPIFLSACTASVKLPLAPIEYCQLEVVDNRLEKESMYIYGDHLFRAPNTPSVSKSLQSVFCSEKSNSSPARFLITDFECKVTGAFSSTFTIELKGVLEKASGEKIAIQDYLQATNDFGGFVDKGCEQIAAPLLKKVTEKIIHNLEG